MAVINCINCVLDVVNVVRDVVTVTKNMVCGTSKAMPAPALHLLLHGQPHYQALAMQERSRFSSSCAPAWRREPRLSPSLSCWRPSPAAAAI